MKGEDLKNRLKSTAIPMSEIANKMGIMPQSLYSIFNSEDVKSGVLEKLSQVLEVPIAYFYGDSYNVQGNGNALATGDHSTASSSDDRLIELLMSRTPSSQCQCSRQARRRSR
jgi:transcriptional regulator with XRE-family HTH domain